MYSTCVSLGIAFKDLLYVFIQDHMFFLTHAYFILKYLSWLKRLFVLLYLNHLHLSLWFHWQRNWDYVRVAICQNTDVVRKICIYCFCPSDFSQEPHVLCLFKGKAKRAENIKIRFEENLVLFRSVVKAATWNICNSSTETEETRCTHTYIYTHSCTCGVCVYIYKTYTRKMLRTRRH